MSLRLVMARDVPGADIGRAFDEALRPRMEHRESTAGGAADRAALRRIRGYFAMDRISNRTEIVFAYSPPGRLVVVMAGTGHEPIDSPALCRALFDIYLGADAISKQGRRSVIEGFPPLLV